ncbi:C40 family peptidase [Bergeriella denitrificans]|uniref:Outer membrane protein GNA2001 n=1 Tax=Bergeriella denitrificans TaxID=494 RepID=A0A378UI98_BERDE|nr:C40 family peptidase [Bergeriella denitrificans]STZ77104.1 Outer membrane protein precursor GNA2001 [Bergeriella denitrificans]
MTLSTRLAAAFSALCLLLSAGGQTRADEIENLLNRQSDRQQILRQFENSGTGSPAPAKKPLAQIIPAAQPAAAASTASGSADELIRSAMGLLGVAYRYGGTSARTGFDCSGFMQHIFRRSMGLNLPRTSAEQAKMGTHVNRGELQAGDMVFFRTMGGGRISHVGLYIGNNRFIHAPRTGKSIEITSLSNKYWGSKYAFGRRVKKHDTARFIN